MIHAPGSGRKVTEANFTNYWTLIYVIKPYNVSKPAGAFPNIPTPGGSTNPTPAPSQPVVKNNIPIGHVDNVSSSSYKTLSISGWTYDPDTPSQSIDYHVYIGGPAGNGGEFVYSGKTDINRPDVGISGIHGFNTTFKVNRTGQQQVYVYAIDSAGGNNPCIGNSTVSINAYVPSSNVSVASGHYSIASAVNNNYVLDVDGTNVNSNCANVSLYSANGGNNQLFSINNLGNGYYTITCVASGKAVEAYNLGLADGTNVIQYEKTNSNQQQWAIQDAGDGYVYFINRLNGLYLDLNGATAANGQNIHLYSSNGSTAQKWKIFKGSNYIVRNGMYCIYSGISSGYYLNADNSGNVVLGEADERSSEIFQVESNTDGTYRIKHLETGKYLTAYNNGSLVNAELRSYDGAARNQKWIFDDVTATGYCNIVSYEYGDLRLDVDNAWAIEGNNVKLFERNDDYKKAQMWNFKAFSKKDQEIEIGYSMKGKQVKSINNGNESEGFEITTYNGVYGSEYIIITAYEPNISVSSSNTNVATLRNDGDNWYVKIVGSGTTEIIITRTESANYKAATEKCIIEVKNVETTDKNWSYEFCEGSATNISIIDYIGDDKYTMTSVEIPGEIDGYTVKELQNGIFQGAKIESVTLPEGLQKIGRGIFFSCLELKSVIVPSTVTEIGNMCFYGCPKLEQVMIGPKTTTFGENLFRGFPTNFVVYGVAGSEIQNYIEQTNATIEDASKRIHFVPMSSTMENMYYPYRPEKVEKPASNKIPGMIIPEDTVVTISTDTPGAEIYITTDGTDPSTENWQIHRKESLDIRIAESCVIKAIATKEEFLDSDIYTAEYTVKQKVKSPAFSQENGFSFKKNSLLKISCATDDAEIYYTTDGTRPTKTNGKLYSGAILLDDNFVSSGSITINAIAVKDNCFDSDVIVARYYVLSEQNELYSVKNDDIPLKGIPEELWSSGIEEAGYMYTGTAIKPEIRVYYGVTLLEEGKDYTISYKNNVNAYTLKEGDSKFDYSKAPSVIVKGKGNYAGSLTNTFVINPISLEDALSINKATYNPTVSELELKHNGKSQKGEPKISIELNGKTVTLRKNKDYLLNYEETGSYAYINPGVYDIKIDGSGNYSGRITTREKIVPANSVHISKAKVSKIDSQQYNGANIVLGDNLILTYDRPLIGVEEKNYSDSTVCDYTYRYENNTDIGTARIIIKGKGSFYGERIVTFKITGTSLNSYAVYGLCKSYDYTGSAIESEDLIVRSKSNPEEVLDEGTDYVVSYTNNINKGTAKVVVTGVGRFTGKISTSFKITPASFDYDINVECDDIHTVKYQKGGAKPVPNISFRDKKLVNGKDYTVSYKNNNKISNFANLKNKPSMIVKGKGNFTGTIIMPFEIEMAALAETSALIGDVVYKNKANICKPSIAIYDNGVKLKAGTDYDSNIVYKYKSTEEPVQPTDIIAAGTEIVATIEGKGCYEGSKNIEFRFVEKNISGATVSVPSYAYTGEEIKPTYDEIKVLLKGAPELVGDKDYIIEYPASNIANGKGLIRIRGIGNYGGTKDVKFNIIKRTMNYTILYDKNSDEATGTMSSANIAAGGKLSDCRFKRAGYTFVGWNTKADGSGASYSNKEIFRVKNLIQIFGGEIKLYAQWQENL